MIKNKSVKISKFKKYHVKRNEENNNSPFYVRF